MPDEIYEDRILGKGWYSKPRLAVKMLKDKYISKAAYLLLDLLLNAENAYTDEPNEWFYHSNEKLCATRLISPKTLVKARIELKEKGLIEFKSGWSKHATDYRILIEGKYYYRGGDSVENIE